MIGPRTRDRGQWTKKIGFIVYLFFFLSAFPVHSDSFDNALSVKVARDNLKQAMQEIAADIGKQKKEFPQLKKWRRAEISDNQIRYQYKHKKISCDLLIYSKNTIELVSAGSELPNELKVGIYLKMNATGENAEALKETLRQIVAKHFQKLRHPKNEDMLPRP